MSSVELKEEIIVEESITQWAPNDSAFMQDLESAQ